MQSGRLGSPSQSSRQPTWTAEHGDISVALKRTRSAARDGLFQQKVVNEPTRKDEEPIYKRKYNEAIDRDRSLRLSLPSLF